MIKTKFTLKSHDEKTTLHGSIWKPEGEPKAIVQLVHGMQEYIDRYDGFAEYLTERGYVVIGHDHLGHGDSVCSTDDWGFFEENHGNAVLLADIHQVRARIQEQYPDCPYFILGHSMGSFLVRQYICQKGEGIDGVVIMGTGDMPKEMLRFAMFLSSWLAGIKGWRAKSKFIDLMAFGSYNKKIKPHRSQHDWLTRDEEIVDRYDNDPKDTFRFTLNGYYNLFYSMYCLKDKKYLEGCPKDLPVLLVSGEADPVGSYGKGPTAVKAELEKIGLTSVELKLYPDDRHEILNELDKAQVYQDLGDWFDRKIEG